MTPDDLALWLQRAGVTAQARPIAVPPEVLAEARELREAIDACVEASIARRPSPGTAVDLIDRWLVHAGARPQLGAIALDAARMLGRPEERERVRVCASDTCSARFYDRSPAGRRRWCSMRTCGNEAKARRHRARTRSAA